MKALKLSGSQFLDFVLKHIFAMKKELQKETNSENSKDLKWGNPSISLSRKSSRHPSSVAPPIFSLLYWALFGLSSNGVHGLDMTFLVQSRQTHVYIM